MPTGVTPARLSDSAVEAVVSMASATSRRSTVTKESPAFLAASSAALKMRASGWASESWPLPPVDFGSLRIASSLAFLAMRGSPPPAELREAEIHSSLLSV